LPRKKRNGVGEATKGENRIEKVHKCLRRSERSPAYSPGTSGVRTGPLETARRKKGGSFSTSKHEGRGSGIELSNAKGQ